MALPSGTRVRIQSETGDLKRTHFVGHVSRVEPDEGTLGRKQAVIELVDMQPWLAASPARLTPQVNVTADQVIARLLDAATLRRPILAGHCLIDVAGYNMIDATRIFPLENAPRRLAQGKTRFAYVGDWWRESLSAREAIGEIVASERGRFFINREGEAVFLNRHHALTHKTLTARFADDMSGMAYSYGDQRLNRLSLLLTPREIGESGLLLWQLRVPQRIEQRSELLLILRPVDEFGESVGLLALDRLEARFRETATGEGDFQDDDVRAEITQFNMTSVQLRLSNRKRTAVYLTLLELYGRPLYRREPLEIVVEDGESMHLYGLKQMTLDLPALSDMATAQAFASYEVARRKRLQGTIRQLRVNAREHERAALQATLFDRIRVSELQTGHGARDYFIVAEEHHVHEGGARHDVIWTLEPADSTRFAIVDDSQINDQSEVLAPY